MDDASFRRAVIEELDEIGRSYGLANQGSQFEIWFGSRILGEDEAATAETYRVGAGGDEKIDLGICDEDHEVNLVVQCKFAAQPFTFNKDVIDEVLNAVRRAYDDPEAGTEKRRAFVKKLNESEKPLIKAAVCFGDVELATREYAARQDVELYDFARLHERYEYLTTPGHEVEPESIILQVNPPGVTRSSCVARPASTPGDEEVASTPRLEPLPQFEMAAFLANIKDIYSAVKENKDGIFQANLRYRLVGRSEGRIGKQIEHTIVNAGPLLLPLNNGITLVCRDIIEQAPSTLQLIRPQIVNGGQTAWAIHDACSELESLYRAYYDGLDLSILVKAIKTDDAKFIQQITEATNNQNPIYPRDQRADRLEQIEIQRAFDGLVTDGVSVPVLFEQKRGQFEVLVRMHKQGRYRIRGVLFRRIENEFAGQLYLALLGVPHSSKNRKREIFENESIYNTIFNTEQPAKLRFQNDELEIDPKSVPVRSAGPLVFRDDIIFGFALYRLTDIISRLHARRVEAWPVEETDTNNYRILTGHKFLQFWQYHAVFALNYIVESIARGDETQRSRLRAALVGTDLNRIYERGLLESFHVQAGTASYLILDEESPSVDYPTYGAWITSLIAIVYDLVSNAKTKQDWKSERHFFDLRSDTTREIRSKLDEILGGPKAVRVRWFPLPP